MSLFVRDYFSRVDKEFPSQPVKMTEDRGNGKRPVQYTFFIKIIF